MGENVVLAYIMYEDDIDRVIVGIFKTVDGAKNGCEHFHGYPELLHWDIGLNGIEYGMNDEDDNRTFVLESWTLND